MSLQRLETIHPCEQDGEVELLGRNPQQGCVPPSWRSQNLSLEMVGIYGESFALRGAESQIVSSIRAHCLSHPDEYTHTMARDPERWVISFGTHSAKNSFGVDKHAGATIDVTIAIGLFIRVLKSAVVEGFKPCSSERRVVFDAAREA